MKKKHPTLHASPLPKALPNINASIDLNIYCYTSILC